MKNQKRLDNKGFSLVELIVVIAIMAVLMGVLAPTLIGNIEKSRESTDLQNLDTIRGGVVTAMANEKAYKDIMDAMPDSGNIVIHLGGASSAKVDGMSLKNGKNGASLTNFEAELKNIINQSIAMKSAAANGNDVYIVINQNSAVTAIIAEDEGKAGSYEAILCKKTDAETSGKKPLLSGANS